MTSFFHAMVHIQWLGGSGHRRATHHPLPSSERYLLARSWQQTIWLGGALRATSSRVGGEVNRLRVPYFIKQFIITAIGGILKLLSQLRIVNGHMVKQDPSKCWDGRPWRS